MNITQGLSSGVLLAFNAFHVEGIRSEQKAKSGLRKNQKAVKTVNMHLTQTSARYINLPQLPGYRILNLSAPVSEETCELHHPMSDGALSIIKQLYARQVANRAAQ